jgi:DNA-binding XRE family transcriptional regulator
LRVDPPSPIELARRDRGWRQADLAEQAGVSRHTIALSERGYRPSEKSRLRIAAALDTTVVDLWPDVQNDDAPVAIRGAVTTEDANAVPTSP